MERADALYVGNMLSGELTAQEHLGTLVADWAGLRGIEAVKVEAACASGAAAVRMGYLAVASGMHDFVDGLRRGKDHRRRCEKRPTPLGAPAQTPSTRQSGHDDAGMAGLLMRRYMYEFGVQHEDFAPFPSTPTPTR